VVKITELPLASGFDGTEALPIVQGSATRRTLISQLIDRAHHTGQQAMETITGLPEALDAQEAADTALHDYITDVGSALQTNIDGEAHDRLAADNALHDYITDARDALQTNITGEANDRLAAVNALSDRIDAETAARTSAGYITSTGPTLRAAEGAPDDFGGYALLAKPAEGSSLAGPVLAGLRGNQYQIFVNAEGDGRGVYVDLSAMLPGSGARLLTSLDLSYPIFRGAESGVPADWGGGVYLKKPITGSTLVGNVLLQVVGDELIIGDLDGDGRGVRVNLKQGDEAFGSRLLTDRAPTLRAAVGAPDYFGGYTLLSKPNGESDLAGEALAGLLGNRYVVYVNAGDHRGLYFDLTTMLPDIGTRGLTELDLSYPIFRGAESGVPEDWGGGVYLKKPTTGSTLAGDVLVQVVGDELIIGDLNGAGRGVRVNIKQGDEAFGSRLLTDRAPTLRAADGAATYFGGYQFLTRPTSGTTLQGDVFQGVIGDRAVIFDYGSGHQGAGINLPACLPDIGSNVVLDSDGDAALTFSAIYLRHFAANVRSLEISGYYTPGTGGAANIDRYHVVRVAAGPAHYGRAQDADGNWWEVARQPVIRPEMFGAKGADTFGEAVDESSILSFLCDEWADIGQTVYLSRVHRVASYEAFRNLRACRFVGPGDIIYPVLGTPDGPATESGHLSAIFDHDDRLESAGEEYLVHLRNRLRSHDSIRAVLFGDSRWAGAGDNGLLHDANNFAQTIIPKIALDLGLPSAFSVNNLAVASKNFSDQWNGATADGTIPSGSSYPNLVGGTTPMAAIGSGNYEWVIICHGINEFTALADDVGRPGTVDAHIAALIADYDTKFAAMRAAAPVENLTISWFGPTSASHVKYQTSDAVRKLDRAMRRLCRLHQIHHVDCYSRWSDSARMGGITTDQYYMLHNQDMQAAAVFGMLRDHMRRWFVTADLTNSVINPPFWVDDGPGASALPSSYPLGQSGYEVTTGEGWPAYGYLETVRSGSGGRGYQTLWGDDGVKRQRQITSATTWGDWK